MTVLLSYEYCLALRDAGYPQPEFADGQTWYQTGLCNEVHITQQWMHNYGSGYRFKLLVQKARLVYAPGFDELVKVTGALLTSYLTIEELAAIWLAINKKR
jgi:hypothetical protein